MREELSFSLAGAGKGMHLVVGRAAMGVLREPCKSSPTLLHKGSTSTTRTCWGTGVQPMEHRQQAENHRHRAGSSQGRAGKRKQWGKLVSQSCASQPKSKAGGACKGHWKDSSDVICPHRT